VRSDDEVVEGLTDDAWESCEARVRSLMLRPACHSGQLIIQSPLVLVLPLLVGGRA
jgi:hypothetical protein